MSKKELQEFVDSNYEKVNGMYVQCVVCYIRVSTQEQKMHGLSIEAQKMKLQEYAEKHGLKIVGWYIDEGVSGKKLIRRRPQLQKMINDAKQGQFERILFIKLDRYFRSVAEYHECQKILNENHVTWTATEEKYDLTTANGRAFVNMKLTIAELEADQTGERIVIVNDYKVKAGLPLYGSHSLPFYYTNLQVGEHKRVMQNPETAEIFEAAYEHFTKFQSIRGTMQFLMENYGFVINYPSLKKALKNEMLYGMYKGNPEYIKEPYLTKEEYDRLQTMISVNKKKGTNREYIFSGMLLCPCCGRRLIGDARKASSDKTKYRLSYKCSKSHRDKACDYKTIWAENRIEKFMLRDIEKYLENAKIEAAEISQKNARISKKANLQELEDELDRLNYQFRKGFLKDVAQYERECEALHAKIEKATMKHQDEAAVDFEKIEGILSGNWKDIYLALDSVHRRAFWKSFIKSIEITPNRSIAKVNFF